MLLYNFVNIALAKMELHQSFIHSLMAAKLRSSNMALNELPNAKIQ